MIPPSLRPRIWKYSHGNKKAYSGMLAARLVEALYPENQLAYEDICKAAGVMKDSTRNGARLALYRLKKGSIVSQAPGRRYQLTDLGRWFAISHSLGLSFAELCILASACCIHERYAKSGSQGFYLHSHFERTFKEYYSSGHISNLFSSLARKGLVLRHSKKTIRISPDVRKGLMARYGKYFERLESWLDSLEENELEIFGEALEGFRRGDILTH